MLEKSDTSISDVLKVFNIFKMDVGFIVPTLTGINKSIMDATASVRSFLREENYHNYDWQNQGTDSKVINRAFFVHHDCFEETTVSLYRPITKKGDPRIWFKNLASYAQPYNLLALLVHNHELYIVNCSKPYILRTINIPQLPLGSLAASVRSPIDPVAFELIELIKEISSRGYVKTKRPGDTGVGMTLEYLLGIRENANKIPDYKGIEIKAKRLNCRSESRVTLFSQAPNWPLSPIKSAWTLLSRYGYVRDGKLRLNHEIDASGPNSLGFYLELNDGRDWLKQMYYDKEAGEKRHVITWELETLRDRLRQKHPQTFWVGARSRGRHENEEFHYVQIAHTQRPKVRNFDALLEGGVISVDYLMSQKRPDLPSVRDHGYLFKMHARDFDALFPPSDLYDLLEK